MVAVVCPVTDPPAVVRYQDRGMGDVTNKVVDLLVAAETLVTTARLRTSCLCNTEGQQIVTYQQQCTGRWGSLNNGRLRYSPVMPNHKQRPKHGSLCQPVQRPRPPAVARCKLRHCRNHDEFGTLRRVPEEIALEGEINHVFAE